jgi:hypothetical protein
MDITPESMTLRTWHREIPSKKGRRYISKVVLAALIKVADISNMKLPSFALRWFHVFWVVILL